MSAPAYDRETILRVVRHWPINEQIALADAILADAILADARTATGQVLRPPTVPSAALRGILSNDQPAPSDEDVARMLDEERMKKYGE
ncbi:MAG TPA: hypothetical protein VFU60_18945 [Ktedonobacterales bacterium]|nr:hypothetical protein [Ktedonobacterales bacterium]